MDLPATFYLSSLDSVRFEPVRRCELIEYRTFDSGKVAAVAVVDPAVPGQDLGRLGDIDQVLLTPRHEGVEIDAIDEFPCFVFIAVPAGNARMPVTPIRSDELQVIAWGELYRTADDAASHRFD
jgi:hypothetical protein